MKTYNKWTDSRLSLTDYLSIGDKVHENIIDYVIGVLPPATMASDCVQMGEPYTHIDGHPCYITFQKIGQNWLYAGIWPVMKDRIKIIQSVIKARQEARKIKR